jgi:phosphoglycerol transferase MdoB-like AlkP superfamily enzyme
VQMGCHHRADDAMAILFAFQSPELDVIGLTTTYGNVKTTMATNNALHLVWRSSSLCLSLCVSPFQFVLFLQFQLQVWIWGSCFASLCGLSFPICPVFAIPVMYLHLGFRFQVMLLASDVGNIGFSFLNEDIFRIF